MNSEPGIVHMTSTRVKSVVQLESMHHYNLGCYLVFWPSKLFVSAIYGGLSFWVSCLCSSFACKHLSEMEPPSPYLDPPLY